ncbi:MAG: DUF2971 domain-containing protein [Smithella sp.]
MNKDDILYHYTSISGLNCIIQSNKVWASDCRYLNDSQELVRALDLFLSKFDGKKKEALSIAFHWHNFSRIHCIFSLSNSPHVLSQWRAYADDGRGAAIGFNKNMLKGIGNAETKFIVDCVYDNQEIFIGNIIVKYEEEINSLVEMYEKAGAVNTFYEQINQSPSALEKLYRELIRIKNPAFSEEQEVRLFISAPANQGKTRVSRGLIIPYIEHEFVPDGDDKFKWCLAPEIWLGPKCDKRNEQAILAYQQFGWVSGIGLHKYDCGYV